MDKLLSFETFACFFISFLALGQLVYSTRKSKVELFSPLNYIVVIYFFYTVAGPIAYLNNDFNVFPPKYVRPYYTIAWSASIYSILAVFLGYYIYAGKPLNKVPLKKNIINYQKSFYAGLYLSLLGLFLYAVPSPAKFIAQLNPFGVGHLEADRNLSGFANYFSLALNFTIPGNCLMLLSCDRLKFKWTYTFKFSVILVMTILIYSSLGFRFRILMLIVTLLASYYIINKKRPSILLLSIIIPMIISVMGFIGVARTYGKGLDLSRTGKVNSSNFLVQGFKDASIFPISGLVISSVPEKYSHIGLGIFYNALVFPIPRTFLPDKDTDSYIREPIKSHLPLRRIKAHKWSAMMYFAEWYIAFGWFGLIGSSLFLGFVSRRIWEATKENLNDVFSLTFYSTCLSFVYIIITRGYFPFIVMSYFFTIYPIAIVRKIIKY